jgi:hypothetical protein
MNSIIRSALPVIATALGGPLAGLATKFIADKVGIAKEDVESFISDVTNTGKLTTIEADFKLKLEALGIQSTLDLEALNLKAIEAINTTMQAEAAAEHWPTYSWRPYNGFLFGTTIFGSYFILPLLHIPVPSIPEYVWIAWGAVLGIASWFRGKMQSESTGK